LKNKPHAWGMLL